MDANDEQWIIAAIRDPANPSHRRAIAKAITLLESSRADHRERANELLTSLLSASGNSFRLGISGVPGVGKSTFIEALGLLLLDRGHRVAVLAVDPSSSLSGGSILGDKTRMERLSVDQRAFIRPSPTAGTLGGVTEQTREAMLIVEAAGHDIVIVETVGVGQSEIAVAGMTDMFVLLQLPNAGDDLQAIKRGIMELADLVVINKADLDPVAATRAQAQITSALNLHGQRNVGWQARVIQVAALKNQGIDTFWSTVEAFQAQQALGQYALRRQQQNETWMNDRIDAGLKTRFRTHPKVMAALAAITAEVSSGQLAASVAARRLLDMMD
ncbi:MAG: methylmalonyl Co-A mutase-associated GTPase MeaB [Gammaproteobacteria bacterium]|nr:methylmalonyl Co-A mutase-associated GTPase MeaB [Gammaproteobacteria bacterium]